MTELPLPSSIREKLESGQLPLMPPEFDVKDVEMAEAAKREALQRVDEHADEEWKERALLAILALSREREFFTSDDLWERIEKPREPRALGPVLLRAAKLGYCAPSGRYLKCKIPTRHQAPIREYRSLFPR